MNVCEAESFDFWAPSITQKIDDTDYEYHLDFQGYITQNDIWAYPIIETSNVGGSTILAPWMSYY